MYIIWEYANLLEGHPRDSFESFTIILRALGWGCKTQMSGGFFCVLSALVTDACHQRICNPLREDSKDSYESLVNVLSALLVGWLGLQNSDVKSFFFVLFTLVTNVYHLGICNYLRRTPEGLVSKPRNCLESAGLGWLRLQN